MERVKIGVMGCASIAIRSIIPAILQLSDKYELVAVSSRDYNKAIKVASQFGCQAIEGYQNLLELPNIDAVYIPLPTGLHYTWIKKAIEKRKHVYAEKSFTLNYKQAFELVELAKKLEVSLMEGYMFQYHSQNIFVKEKLKKNAIGDIRHFSASFCFPPLPSENFRYDAEIGGGVVMDAAGYTVRATHFILGDEFTPVASSIHYRNRTGIYGSAYFRNNKDIGASLVFGFDNFYQCEYRILGTKGKITLTKAFTPRKSEVTECIVEEQGVKTIYSLPACDHFEEALKEFSSIIRDEHLREQHYNEILLQSNSLTKITELSNK